MKKTFQQFIAENPHFADVQQMRETGDHSGYLRRALEKAWNAGYDAGLQVPFEFEMQLPPKHADAANATREGIDKRLGATGQALE